MAIYAFAKNLVGFSTSVLRVRVEEFLGDEGVRVRTADLADAGTPLVLKTSQIVLEEDAAGLVRPVGGLVWFEI